MTKHQSAASRPPRRRTSEDRFIAINRERLRRIRDSLSLRQCDFLELLPLLFHVNHPMLPGYLTQTTPCGIRDYSPSPETLAAAQRVTRSYSHDRRAQVRLDVLGLYMMGSCGTIAYTPGSDFDIWLCHAPGLDEAAVTDLREKATRVEQAARAVDLDVHFFVFDHESFRNGQLASLSAESSGSSQHYLLLDEFYRSAVVLAGLYPLWWKVPPEEESNYNAYVEKLLTGRFVGQNDYIDFGGLERIPAEEFFGAAVWQLYKSINSPYKSVLKLILIEAYAEEYPKIDLLALRYKKMVYDGETSILAMDPYLLMYRKVEDYLAGRGETERLNLYRRCFYFKVEEKLSVRPARPEENWRRETMLELVGQWGWDTPQLALLDSRENWKVPVVTEQRRDLIAALTQSYRLLSQFGRDQADAARISQRDLHVLGRKLYAAFERKAGKIEIVNRGIAPDLAEERLTLHQLRDGDEASANWLLFTEAIGPQELGQQPAVRRSMSVVDVLAWCHFNRLIDERTQISAYAGGQVLSTREIRATLNALNTVFPDGTLHEAGAGDLTRPPRVLRTALFINVGAEHPRGTLRGGDLVASSRTDPLSFGGLHENLTECIDLVLMTSWEEVFSYHYRGIDGLMHCLCEFLRLRTGAAIAPEVLATYCFVPGHGATISRRFQTLLEDLSRCVQESSGHWRYVLEAADHYYVFIRDEAGIHHEKLGDYKGLLEFLARPVARFVQTRFDRQALRGQVLPVLFQNNREDAIQVFLRTTGNEIEVFVLDERGSLFTQTARFLNQHVLIDHLARFFRSTSQRMSLASGNGEAPPRVEFRQLVPNGRGGHYIEAVSYNPDLGRQYLQLKVLVEPAEDSQRTHYTVLCDGREFTSLVHGNELFHVVARHVLSLRRDHHQYPIYVTDIDLSGVHGGEVGGHCAQTTRMLDYKSLIEDRLNQALTDLETSTA